ncbi:aminotransferase class I/II-fold pyridoxal phosphate-dependent enzyme [Actinomyces sp. B33]|uniref:MalY/PatB family protein n=1 Tax=Actinomyces sp. B33 TaxID=2942131 RepID=UPI002341753C|nr:aminotransferase class I/II-fold pyridoxal phosphate-dependent enzyme [Actinomyces sp. B33]MDC4233588.1 aminotransferase class I/II-fold pyridoxal phosphate-dependent enzyme [Actinomyces sp. B33]
MSTSPRFDEHLDRWGTHSAKWDLLAADLGPDAICLSVADMELRTAPCVSDAVIAAARHSNYGYTEIFDDFADAAVFWQRSRHGWGIYREDVLFYPRVVQCVAALVNVVLADRGTPPVVVTLDPAYGPLIDVARASGARIRRVPLVFDAEGRAGLDVDSLDGAMNGADLLLWCNPHNPTGRVWASDELAAVADIARARNVLILSDDIHADFTRPGRAAYTPLASIAPDLYEDGRLVHCASPGKTFTTAGLEATAILVRGETRRALEAAKRRMGLHNPTYFAVPAAIAAWTQGGPWVDELVAFIDANLTRAVARLREGLPGATVTDPDGTYLIWVSAPGLIVGDNHLADIRARSRVAVSPGIDFGPSWDRCFRINTALPTRELDAGLDRLITAITTR